MRKTTALPNNDRTLLPADTRRVVEHLAARGISRDTNATLIGYTAGGAEVWHTDSAEQHTPPPWPPGPHREVLYRGVSIDRLPLVFSTGSDQPPHDAFFATDDRSKAWEYPSGRTIGALLVYDRALTERSYVAAPTPGDPSVLVDTERYPNRYTDTSSDGRTWTVYTRFTDRVVHSLDYERLYGHWIPGDARDALLGIILGGPRNAVAELCTQFAIEGHP